MRPTEQRWNLIQKYIWVVRTKNKTFGSHYWREMTGIRRQNKKGLHHEIGKSRKSIREKHSAIPKVKSFQFKYCQTFVISLTCLRCSQTCWNSQEHARLIQRQKMMLTQNQRNGGAAFSWYKRYQDNAIRTVIYDRTNMFALRKTLFTLFRFFPWTLFAITYPNELPNDNFWLLQL